MVGIDLLLSRARQAGLEVRVDDSRLVVRGPRRAEERATELLTRKAEILAFLAGGPTPPERQETAEAMEDAYRELVQAMEEIARRYGALPPERQPELSEEEGRRLDAQIEAAFRSKDPQAASVAVEAWRVAWETLIAREEKALEADRSRQDTDQRLQGVAL